VKIEGKGSRVLGSDNRTRGDENGKRKGERSVGMADTKVCQRCTEIFGTGELLSSVHRRVCISGETIT